MSVICTQEDEFLREWQEDHGRALWVVRMSDGKIVFQDDGRAPPHTPDNNVGHQRPAWTRLKSYLLYRANPHFVVALGLKFRERWVWPPCLANRRFYFFCKSALFGMGGFKQDRYIIGGGDSPDKIITQAWQVPALILEEDGQERSATLDNPCLLYCGDISG